MPEYLSPGVYIEETSFRSKSIEGVSTSVCGMVGPVRFGPLGPGEPELLTSFADFQRLYGDLSPLTFTADGAEAAKENYVALGAKAFFDNGGTKLYVKRVACIPEDSGFAAGPVTAGVAFKARFAGSGGNGEVVVEEALSENVLVGLDGGPFQLAGVGPGALVSIFSGANEPVPARAVAGTGPFDLEPPAGAEATTLTVEVVGTGSVSVRFSERRPARVELTPVPPFQPTEEATVTVTVDGRPTEVTFEAGSYDGFQLANALNVVHGISVQLLAGGLVLEHDTAGAGHTLRVQGGPFDDVGESSEGAGNVEVLAQATVQEVLAALEAASSEAWLALGSDDSGHLSIATTRTGPTARLTITSDKLDAFGFTDPAPDGGSVEAKGSGVGELWHVEAGGLRNHRDQVSSLQSAVEAAGDNPQAKVVSYFVTVKLATGAEHSYGPVSFDAESGDRYIGNAMPLSPSKRFDELTQPLWFEDTNATKKTVFAMRDALLAKRWRVPLTGGTDGADPVAADYERGLEALRLLEEISIVCAPGYSRRLGREGASAVKAINEALTTHVKKARYCIALLDPEPDSTVGTVRNYKADIDDSRLALYYPWVVTANPNASPWKKEVPSEVSQPPSGFIAGIYARNDVERGVHKAPANEVVRGALRFEVALNKAHQDVLNPEGINALRRFEGRGLRVWGARTCSSDPEWKYVNVRRFMLYLERSIELSTQWAVFEPNGPRLWSNVTTAVSDFLYSEWRKGALLGADPKQAYFVRCDLTTMDQNDLDNGRMVCLIGVAPVRPAEFVIFRIGQKTATSAE